MIRSLSLYPLTGGRRATKTMLENEIILWFWRLRNQLWDCMLEVSVLKAMEQGVGFPALWRDAIS